MHHPSRPWLAETGSVLQGPGAGAAEGLGRAGQGQCPGDPQPTLPRFPAVMRCLGVPSRVVTNYNSAHDTNGNLVIDRYMNETGVEERRSKDMIW